MKRDKLLSGFGSAWFFVLAILSITAVLRSDTSTSLMLARSPIVLLYLLFGVLILIRPVATSQAKGLLPRAMAFIGTYMPWTISFIPATDYTWATLLSPIFVIGGMMIAIVAVLYLGTAFSLVPQARTVVQSGPYRWLRHPLYAAEEIAIVGVLLQHLTLLSVAIVTLHIVVQISRISFEEKLLGETFPNYRLFSADWRLVPFVY